MNEYINDAWSIDPPDEAFYYFRVRDIRRAEDVTTWVPSLYRNIDDNSTVTESVNVEFFPAYYDTSSVYAVKRLI